MIEAPKHRTKADPRLAERSTNMAMTNPVNLKLMNQPERVELGQYAGFLKWGYPIAGWFVEKIP